LITISNFTMTTIKPYISLIDQIWWLLNQGRKRVVSRVNQTMVVSYRTISQYIVEYEQGGADRAKYGSWLLQKLSDDLTSGFGRGLWYRNLHLIRPFYLEYQNWHAIQSTITNPYCTSYTSQRSRRKGDF